MKELTIRFTDAEFRKLNKAKKNFYAVSWKDFIIRGLTKGVSEKRNGNNNKLKIISQVTGKHSIQSEGGELQ